MSTLPAGTEPGSLFLEACADKGPFAGRSLGGAACPHSLHTPPWEPMLLAVQPPPPLWGSWSPSSGSEPEAAATLQPAPSPWVWAATGAQKGAEMSARSRAGGPACHSDLQPRFPFLLGFEETCQGQETQNSFFFKFYSDESLFK